MTSHANRRVTSRPAGSRVTTTEKGISRHERTDPDVRSCRDDPTGVVLADFTAERCPPGCEPRPSAATQGYVSARGAGPPLTGIVCVGVRGAQSGEAPTGQSELAM